MLKFRSFVSSDSDAFVPFNLNRSFLSFSLSLFSDRMNPMQEDGLVHSATSVRLTPQQSVYQLHLKTNKLGHLMVLHIFFF